jgi:hypothetical protein
MTTLVICIPNSEGTFDSQLQCKNDINDAAVLLSQPVEQAVDIANYAYIWFNNVSDTITEKEKDFIHETITKGTFPTYLQDYTDADKAAILANEIEFVRKKFSDNGLPHITILQIPRILYDLFNLLYFYHTHLGKSATSEEIITYTCFFTKQEHNIDAIDKYNKYTADNINKLKDKIFELNDRIIAFLNTNNFIVSNIIVKDYNDILKSIMDNISKIDKKDRKHLIQPIDQPYEKINILYKILDFEKQPARATSATDNSILLYRGAKITSDSTIEDKKGKQYPYSLSLNLSILSGFIGDVEACTMHYMTDPGVEKNHGKNDKIKYTIKKFMFGDGSEEDSLFFIPPIPPYLQLYCAGELWHPRTKIGNDFPIIEHPEYVKGLSCNKIDFNIEYKYLQSDKTIEQLEEIYQSYKKDGDIATWRKYIKYKTKYLELKNQLGNII